jgi:hypothetical protein
VLTARYGRVGDAPGANWLLLACSTILPSPVIGLLVRGGVVPLTHRARSGRPEPLMVY